MKSKVTATRERRKSSDTSAPGSVDGARAIALAPPAGGMGFMEGSALAPAAVPYRSPREESGSPHAPLADRGSAAPVGPAVIQRFYAVKDERNSAEYPKAPRGKVDKLPPMEWIDLPDPRDEAEYPDTVPGTGWRVRNLYRRRASEPKSVEPPTRPEPRTEPEPRVPERSIPEPKPLPEPKVEPEPKLISEPKIVREPKVMSEPKAISEPEAVSKPEPVSEPTPLPVPKVRSEPKPVEPLALPEPKPVAEPKVVKSTGTKMEVEPAEKPLKTRVEELLEKYSRMKQKLDRTSLGQMKSLTDRVEDDKQGLRENPRYPDAWYENLLEHIPEWIQSADRVGRSQVVRTKLTENREIEEKEAAKLSGVVHSKPDANQKTWVTPEDLTLLEQAQVSLAPALQERQTRASSLGEKLAAQEGIVGIPSREAIGEAGSALEAHGRLAPVVVDLDVLREATRVAQAVSPPGIKKAIAKLVSDAHADPAKGLVLDKGQLTQLQEGFVGKKKSEVVDEIEKRVREQHVPGVAAWRKFLRLEKNATNLYISPAVGRVDGYDTHLSLFKDTIGQAANTNVATTELGALQDQVLGTGVTGFHVTLEQADPGSPKNPSAYRGQPDALKKQFEERPSKSPWDPTVKEGLEALRDTQVAKAETVVEKVKDNLGAPPEKVHAI